MSKKASTELAVKEEAGLPAFLQGETGYTGAEDIDATDITIPQIKVGQGTSAEVKDGTVEEGDLFLNVTGEVLAKAGEPLRFTPIARSKEYILWRDRNFEGGGVMARAKRAIVNGNVRYIWNKAGETFDNKVGGKIKVQWTTEADGLIAEEGLDKWGSEIPGEEDSGKAATAHHNYVVSLPDHEDMIAAFSLSRTQVKAAKDFNAMIRMASLPMFARVFIATTYTQTGGENAWKNIKMKPAGVLQDSDLYAMLKGMHEHYAGAGFAVEQDKGDTAEADGEKGGF
ncbi:MAG: hypothetical protein V3S55_03935 [Nitrospiraceae bacterium]